jgi:hypothetical protein
MSNLAKLLQDYINHNDMNKLNFYSVSYYDDIIKSSTYDDEFIKQNTESKNKEISKESIFKELKNNTYEISDIYKLLSNGKLKAGEIANNTSLEVYDKLMEELKEFDHKVNEEKLKKKEVLFKSNESSNDELAKAFIDFLSDAKELLIIKK